MGYTLQKRFIPSSYFPLFFLSHHIHNHFFPLMPYIYIFTLCSVSHSFSSGKLYIPWVPFISVTGF